MPDYLCCVFRKHKPSSLLLFVLSDCEKQINTSSCWEAREYRLHFKSLKLKLKLNLKDPIFNFEKKMLTKLEEFPDRTIIKSKNDSFTLIFIYFTILTSFQNSYVLKKLYSLWSLSKRWWNIQTTFSYVYLLI